MCRGDFRGPWRGCACAAAAGGDGGGKSGCVAKPCLGTDAQLHFSPLAPSRSLPFRICDRQGLAPTSTNVVATNGGDDPWRGCTLNATLRDSYPESTALCDGCGHCGDLHGASDSDPTELTAQRDLIRSYLASWLSKA